MDDTSSSDAFGTGPKCAHFAHPQTLPPGICTTPSPGGIGTGAIAHPRLTPGGRPGIGVPTGDPFPPPPNLPFQGLGLGGGLSVSRLPYGRTGTTNRLDLYYLSVYPESIVIHGYIGGLKINPQTLRVQLDPPEGGSEGTLQLAFKEKGLTRDLLPRGNATSPFFKAYQNEMPRHKHLGLRKPGSKKTLGHPCLEGPRAIVHQPVTMTQAYLQATKRDAKMATLGIGSPVQSRRNTEKPTPS